MHIEEIPFELAMSVNSNSLWFFLFAEHPKCIRGLLGTEYEEVLLGGHDTMDCETAMVGSLTDLRQTSIWGEQEGLQTTWENHEWHRGKIESKVHGHYSMILA